MSDQQPVIDFETLLTVISSSSRWTILRTLCDSEPLGATDIAGILKCAPSAASKHMRVLVNAGICVQGRGRLYRLAPHFQPPAGQKVMDFGYCLLRLDFQPAS